MVSSPVLPFLLSHGMPRQSSCEFPKFANQVSNSLLALCFFSPDHLPELLGPSTACHPGFIYPARGIRACPLRVLHWQVPLTMSMWPFRTHTLPFSLLSSLPVQMFFLPPLTSAIPIRHQPRKFSPSSPPIPQKSAHLFKDCHGSPSQSSILLPPSRSLSKAKSTPPSPANSFEILPRAELDL